jgi:DNA topoisomerase-1
MLTLTLVVVVVCRLIRGRALACQMASARVAQVAADLVSGDGSLQLRATASNVAFPGFLAAYFDPSVISMAGAGAAAREGDDAEQLHQQEDIEEGAEGGAPDSYSSSKRQQQEQARARAAAAAALAAIQRGQAVGVLNAAASEHETRPPPRFTEGSLVKQLEELGIGRPSTYAPTINLLQARASCLLSTVLCLPCGRPATAALDCRPQDMP